MSPIQSWDTPHGTLQEFYILGRTLYLLNHREIPKDQALKLIEEVEAS